jgi:hypothetical protein
MAPRNVTAKVGCTRQGCTATCPLRLIAKAADNGTKVLCRECTRPYKLPPGARCILGSSPPAKSGTSSSMATELAKLKEENRLLKNPPDVAQPKGTSDIDRLLGEIEGLKVITGTEAIIASKQETLTQLRAKKLADKPSHVQHRELDAKIDKKISQLKRIREETIPELATAIQEAHDSAQVLDADIKSLQDQKQQLVLAIGSTSSKSSGATVANMVGLLELIKSQGTGTTLPNAMQESIAALEKELVQLQGTSAAPKAAAPANGSAATVPPATNVVDARIREAEAEAARAKKEFDDLWAGLEQALKADDDAEMDNVGDDSGHAATDAGNNKRTGAVVDWAIKYRSKRAKTQESLG